MDWHDYLAKRDRMPSGVQKYRKIYEAWKQHYPELSGRDIGKTIGIHEDASKDFIAQLNATGGDFEKAHLRFRSYSVRTRLRKVIRLQPDHPNIADIVSEEARLTKLIADLKTSSAADQIEKRIDAIRKEREWQASGIDG